MLLYFLFVIWLLVQFFLSLLGSLSFFLILVLTLFLFCKLSTEFFCTITLRHSSKNIATDIWMLIHVHLCYQIPFLFKCLFSMNFASIWKSHQRVTNYVLLLFLSFMSQKCSSPLLQCVNYFFQNTIK